MGGPVRATAALQNGVAALQATQNLPAQAWEYQGPGTDISTTHFAVDGLYAAEDQMPGATVGIGQIADFLQGARKVDGGFSYRPAAGDSSSTSMTGVALFLQRLAGQPLDGPAAQTSPSWLHLNYFPDRMVGGDFTPTSTYYAFWTTTKALRLSEGPLGGGHLDASSFGARDPAALGYNEEQASQSFDVAYTLLRWQDAAGQRGTGFGGSPTGWTPFSSHAFALLTLERSQDGVPTPENRVVHECDDGLGNDGDGLSDGLDEDCFFARTPLEDRQPSCINGRDDDADGAVDHPQDLGCEHPWDNDEVNPTCVNGQDDDRDGLIDYPEDPGCREGTDVSESQMCEPGQPVIDIPVNGSVMGLTVQGGLNAVTSSCGGDLAPDATYRYTLAQAADLRVTAVDPAGRFHPIVSIRRDCMDQESEIACAQAGVGPGRSTEVLLEGATAGEYFINVDGTPRAVGLSSRGFPLALPFDLRAHLSVHPFQDNCGWVDGGNDAFDCFGGITLEQGGLPGVTPPVGEGLREVVVGASRVRLTSDFAAQNVCRVRLEHIGGPVPIGLNVTLSSNLGSDAGTMERRGVVNVGGVALPWIQAFDGQAQGDPPVLFMMVPNTPEELARVVYARAGDLVTYSGTGVTLPLTLYTGPSYVPAATVALAIAQDILVTQFNEPGFGTFNLTVREE
ncbi:MAG: hypothetical protein EXR76_07865 [Myxococcales bacterium]|nr:hypothetical protein [Myxococcales bacterium]